MTHYWLWCIGTMLDCESNASIGCSLFIEPLWECLGTVTLPGEITCRPLNCYAIEFLSTSLPLSWPKCGFTRPQQSWRFDRVTFCSISYKCSEASWVSCQPADWRAIYLSVKHGMSDFTSKISNKKTNIKSTSKKSYPFCHCHLGCSWLNIFAVWCM